MSKMGALIFDLQEKEDQKLAKQIDQHEMDKKVEYLNHYQPTRKELNNLPF